MTVPQQPATVEQVPHGRTAQRLDWALLPPTIRRLVESHLGAPVVRAESAGSGFTPGFASVLTGENGARMFVKAASTKAQRVFADSYREEVRNLRALPAGLPVPRLLWAHEDDLWVVLGTEYVDGANPRRPWHPVELEACLDTLEVLADALTPPPEGLVLDPCAEDFAGLLAGWDHVRTTAPHWPHRDEAIALASRFAEVTVGASWIDTVLLLVSAHGDGLDADAILSTRRLTRDVDADDIDVLLALVCGYLLHCGDRPVPSSSPQLRVHQRWYAAATWAWLAQRRGWS